MNYNNFGSVWDATTGAPKHALTLRQPMFMFKHPEINSFGNIAGSFGYMIKNIINSIKFSANNKFLPDIKLKSVLKLNIQKKYDIIITDPPYLDDVIYGEESEFFYVWIKRCLKHFFPELPNEIPLDEDICESWGRFGNKKIALEFFEKGFKQSFVSMNKTLKDDGLLILFFAHSSTRAWNLLLESIRISNFHVVSSYAIHTESTSNVIAQGKTSFMSSIIVVCRKTIKESSEYFEDLVPKIEDKVKHMLANITSEKLLTLSITDLLIMVYGKVLEACTQYTTLKSYQKDFTPDFENLIKDARSFIIKEIVTKLTGRSLNILGSPTAFYLLTKIFHRGKLSSDDALKIARTYGMSIDMLEKNNIAKKDDGVIRLLYLHENELNLKPEEIDKNNLHQQLCYLVQISKKHGASKINPVLSDRRFRKDDLKQIISLLIKSFRLRINKNEKLNDDEKEELEILESISDVMGIKTATKTKGGLDQYFEN